MVDYCLVSNRLMESRKKEYDSEWNVKLTPRKLSYRAI